MLRMDFYRFFHSKRRYLIYLFMFFIVIAYQSATLVYPKTPEFLFPVGTDSAYGSIHIFSFGLGTILAPIFAFLSFGLVAGDWFLKDKKSQFVQQIILREGKKSYVLSHYFLAFLAGAFVLIFPLFINTLITFARARAIPVVLENAGGILLGRIGSDALRDIFLENFTLFIFILLLRAGFLAGMMSMFAIAICNQSESPYLGLFLPYFYSFAISNLLGVVLNSESNLIDLTLGYPDTFGIEGFLYLLPIILFIAFDIYKQLERKDLLFE